MECLESPDHIIVVLLLILLIPPSCNGLTFTEEHASKLILSRPINVNPTSGTTFELIRKWLNDYEQDSALSISLRPISSPSARLLSITSNSSELVPQVCLVKPQKCEKYAALSYCWGPRTEQDSNYYTATKASIARGYSGIPFSELPSTLQDAVIVTKNIGLQYLWIDRLCIVQDDTDDLNRELGKMPTIYGSAYVTISAASAATSTERFLKDRSERVVEQRAVKLKIRAPNHSFDSAVEPVDGEDLGRSGQVSPIHLYPIRIGKDLTSDISEPIQSRAWTMQEHLLSPKVLVFGSRQLRWVSGTSQYIDGGRNDDNMQLPFPFLSVNKSSPFHTAADYEPDRFTTRYSWDALVLEYSKRQLSNTKDKLNALGGLAQRFAEFMEWSSDDYLAGIWRHNLTSQLLWLPERNDILKRPAKYRAPSWSWASVDSWIDSTGFRFGPYQFEFRDDYGVRPPVAEVNCERVSLLNPFGAVKSANLTCKGFVRQVRLVRQNEEYFLVSAGSKAHPRAYLDTTWDDGEAEDRMRRSTCLVIASARPFQYSGLLLVPDGDSHFRREGIWKFDVKPSHMSEKRFEKERKKWFDGCNISAVVIQ
jgi:hypothetical protein